MVDRYGRWTEEQDYSKYPKEKQCDYDYMAVWIRKQEYEPKIPIDDLIANIFTFYEEEVGYHVSVMILRMEILMEHIQKQLRHLQKPVEV